MGQVRTHAPQKWRGVGRGTRCASPRRKEPAPVNNWSHAPPIAARACVASDLVGDIPGHGLGSHDRMTRFRTRCCTAASDAMGQSTKSLRDSPLRGGMNRKAWGQHLMR